MSNEPRSNNGEWQMPDPVFRSSEGHTPKSAKNYVNPDEIDTASPDFMEADTDEFDTEPALDQDEIDTDTPDTEPDESVNENSNAPDRSTSDEVVDPAVRTTDKPTKPAGGCAKSAFMIFGVTAFIVLAIVAVLIYFLFFYTPSTTTF